jgi:amidase
VTTFLLRLRPPAGEGPTLAVKDMIDVEGLPTTCASRAVAETARPAESHAACVARALAAGARLVGKTNLHELAFGGTGVNPYTGTPENPLDPRLVPGGSSSGSAVAVATGEADVALGTDTGGSVRTPSACCGTVGLKTTTGRVPMAGIRPLAPSMDTVGPMAATVGGVVVGMALIEPGFVPAPSPAALLGRFRMPGVAPHVEAAIDRLLLTTGIPTSEAHLPGWDAADRAGTAIVFAEAARVHSSLLARHAQHLGEEVRLRLEAGGRTSRQEIDAARSVAEPWRRELDAALERTPVLAMAGIVDQPPPLEDPLRIDTRRPNVAINLSGHPAIVLPVPTRASRGRRLPTSVQLVGPRGGEELLVATAAVLEEAATT